MPDLKLSSILPRQSSKRLIQEFCENVGMVYFGYVSQRDDEHHILRGMTVSTKHRDDHYCIGSYDGYDVVFVERSDTLRNGKKHSWHIMEFDLKTSVDLPHIFIGSGKHGQGFHELLDIKYPSLKPLALGSLHAYPSTFLSRFKLYASPAHALVAEQLISPEVAESIASHFSGLVIEVTESALYIYSESSRLTPGLLETILKNGVWLAAQIDQKSRLS